MTLSHLLLDLNEAQHEAPICSKEEQAVSHHLASLSPEIIAQKLY